MRGMFGVDTSYAYQLGYDFDSLEAKIEAAYTFKYEGGEEYGEKLVAAKPNDFHTVFAAELTELVGKKVSRAEAKGGVKYGLTYGSQPARLSKSTGWSLQTAEMVFDLFWERASPLKDLKVNLEAYWEGTGKKQFVLGLDGRKIYTRSKHSLLNALFQSAGVICAKRAMVLHDKKLKDVGLSVDFFKEAMLSYAQQMIAYHDEAQMELTKDLVKFKMFASEDEANNFSEEGKDWSDVGHAPDGRSFRAYSIVGQLAADSVIEAGEYYDLPIELTAGYQIGRNWGECH